MSDICKWLHEQLEELRLFKYPFDPQDLPDNGIYFFYEEGEIWGHGGNKPRIVRIGTHKDGNFRSRIREHFLPDESRMKFDSAQPKPSDRSIFRKNIGRALLAKAKDPYLKVWEIDFTMRENRDRYARMRDMKKERQTESAITEILKGTFSFRFIVVDGQAKRMGMSGLEGSLIGTVAQCDDCGPSKIWLGNYSPKVQIRENGLWLVQHIGAGPMSEKEKSAFLRAIEKTQAWLGNDR